MIGKVLYITVLFMLGSYAQRENFIIEGNENLVTSEVQSNEFNFGSNWRGPTESTVCINYRYDEAATSAFNVPEQSFHYFPPGETTFIPLTFSVTPEDFFADPLVFSVVVNDPRICANISKRAPIYQICIQGDSSCNGGYEYMVAIEPGYDTVRSNINFISQPTNCRIISTCDGEMFLEHEYACNDSRNLVQCLETRKQGTQTIVSNYVCDGLNLLRPRCNTCDWIVGPWSRCTEKTCNTGKRTRQVICDCEGQRARNSRCKQSSPKPNRVESCGPPGGICNTVL